MHGLAVTSPNLDAMQEFKMQTNNFSAEYGRMAGGVMNMVLKSGANQVHGSMFEFVRNDVSTRGTFLTSRNRRCGETSSAACSAVR